MYGTNRHYILHNIIYVFETVVYIFKMCFDKLLHLCDLRHLSGCGGRIPWTLTLTWQVRWRTECHCSMHTQRRCWTFLVTPRHDLSLKFVHHFLSVSLRYFWQCTFYIQASLCLCYYWLFCFQWSTYLSWNYVLSLHSSPLPIIIFSCLRMTWRDDINHDVKCFGLSCEDALNCWDVESAIAGSPGRIAVKLVCYWIWANKESVARWCND